MFFRIDAKLTLRQSRFVSHAHCQGTPLRSEIEACGPSPDFWLDLDYRQNPTVKTGQ